MADKTVVYVAGDQTAVPVLYKDLGDGTYAATVPGSLATPVNVLATGGAASSRATAGLTVDQGTADDEALALKSTGDVAHGMTNQANAATYYAVKKISGADGGARVIGLCDTAGQALMLNGMAPTADTGKTAGASGIVTLRAQVQSGASVGAVGANGNLVVIDNDGTTKIVFDAEGEVHADATGGTANSGTGYYSFDEYDDAHLVRALEVARNGPGLIRSAFDDFLKYGRDHLTAARIATFNDGEDGDGSIFVNYTALVRLHSGAIWQMYQRLEAQAAEIADLKSALALRGA